VTFEKYHQYFKNVPNSPAFGDLSYDRVTRADQDYLGLFNKTGLVSILHLSIRDDHGLWQISYSQTDPTYQRQGCFRYLLNKAVDHHGTILSDDHQTSKSKKHGKV